MSRGVLFRAGDGVLQKGSGVVVQCLLCTLVKIGGGVGSWPVGTVHPTRGQRWSPVELSLVLSSSTHLPYALCRFLQLLEQADKGPDAQGEVARLYREFLREAAQTELHVSTGDSHCCRAAGARSSDQEDSEVTCVL